MNESSFSKPESKFFGLSKQMIAYFLVLYIFFILGRAIYENFLLKKQIDTLKKSNIELEQKNKNFENLIIYYQSYSFQELEARDKLALKKPDEQVVLIPVRKIDTSKISEEQIITPKNQKKISNAQAWWSYIFD
ncbi:MAG: septum formation initiator family protein [Candidatus Berkelbacteria bacterium]